MTSARSCTEDSGSEGVFAGTICSACKKRLGGWLRETGSISAYPDIEALHLSELPVDLVGHVCHLALGDFRLSLRPLFRGMNLPRDRLTGVGGMFGFLLLLSLMFCHLVDSEDEWTEFDRTVGHEPREREEREAWKASETSAKGEIRAHDISACQHHR